MNVTKWLVGLWCDMISEGPQHYNLCSFRVVLTVSHSYHAWWARFMLWSILPSFKGDMAVPPEITWKSPVRSNVERLKPCLLGYVLFRLTIVQRHGLPLLTDAVFSNQSRYWQAARILVDEGARFKLWSTLPSSKGDVVVPLEITLEFSLRDRVFEALEPCLLGYFLFWPTSVQQRELPWLKDAFCSNQSRNWQAASILIDDWGREAVDLRSSATRSLECFTPSLLFWLTASTAVSAQRASK